MLSLLIAASLAAADPLLFDSFESGDAAPDGWRQGPAVPGVTYRYEKRRGSDGSRSLALKKTANRYFPIAGWARAVDAGDATRVRVSARVKARKVTKAVIEVQFLGDGGRLVGKEWAAYIGAKDSGDPPATHDWTDVGDAVDVPAGTRQIGVVLQIYGPGEVWFDELRLDAAGDTAGDGEPAAATPDVLEVSAGGGVARYLLHGGGGPAGRPLVIVLPGGDGSAAFAPFVGRLQSDTFGGQAVVAQMLAPSQPVWPTGESLGRVVSAEEAVRAVVTDAATRSKADAGRAVALAWSSGGPAAYSALLADGSPLAGAVVAMSVFKPDRLPPLSAAAGKRVAIIHSPDDAVCPIRMARDAESKLTAAGATVTFTEYAGGHGWKGDSIARMEAAVEAMWEDAK